MIALLLVLKIMRSRICIQIVLKNALVHDGLARGLRECAKALDKRQAHLCVLVETCTEAEYIKLIEALCAEHKINLIKVGDAKVLGTWAGLCKIDREGNPRKIVGCSCVVVKDYGVESEGMHVLLDYFRTVCTALPSVPTFLLIFPDLSDDSILSMGKYFSAAPAMMSQDSLVRAREIRVMMITSHPES